MKTLFKIIALCLLSVSLTFAKPVLNSEYYTGKRLGLVTVGQRLNLSITKDIIFRTDFESFLAKFNGTFFSPAKIYFGTGIEYKQLGLMHYCLHSIDEASSDRFPIRNKFYFKW